MKGTAKYFAFALIAAFAGVAPSMAHDNAEAYSESLHADCSAKLRVFVTELDEILHRNPNSADPVHLLLKKTFPVKNCDIDQAVEIARRSKYFSSAGQKRGSYSITFFRRADSGFIRGLAVTFGIREDTGDSQLPFAALQK